MHRLNSRGIPLVKRLTAIVVAVSMLILMLPTPVLADEKGDYQYKRICNGTSTSYSGVDAILDLGNYDNDWLFEIYSGNTVEVKNSGGKTHTNIQIVCGARTTLILNGVKIDNSKHKDTCPLSFTGDGNHLILKDNSSLQGCYHAPGIKVESGTSLDISGSGYLKVQGGSAGGAGIGGGCEKSAGNITILGGTIDAIAGEDGAGIGGGMFGDGGITNIRNGTVTAISTEHSGSAGIGGGDYGNAGTIVISGGIVYAQRGMDFGTHDIGPGEFRSGGTLKISGDAAVFLKTDSCITPVTTHTYEKMTEVNDDEVYGLNTKGWTNFGLYMKPCTLQFDANDGTGTVPDPVIQHTGTTMTMGPWSELSKPMYRFGGWNTAVDGGGIEYLEGSEYTFDKNTTLFAFWVTPVANVNMSKSSIDLGVGDIYLLSAAIEPVDATYQEIAWSSDDESVITVDQKGKMTAVGVGNATIMATADGQSATCDVTVWNSLKPTVVSEATYTNTSRNLHKITIGTIARDFDITTRIIDSKGKTVVNLEYYKPYQAGTHSVYWNGKDKNGKPIKSGTYTIVAIVRDEDGYIRYTKKALTYVDHLAPTAIMSSEYNKTANNTHPITCDIKFDCNVTVRIRNSSGKTIKNLAYHEAYTAGSHVFKWDGTDKNGNTMPSGNYTIYVIEYDENENYWYTKKSLKYTLVKTPDISTNSRYTKTGANRHLVKFSVAEDSKVTVAIRDANKRTIRNIEYKVDREAGEYSVYWDGKDNKGNVVKSGTYYIYVIRYDNNGKYHYVRKRLTYTTFNYPTIYSNSYYTRIGENRQLIKVDIATDAKVSTCIKDANFKTVLYLEYKEQHDDGRFYVYWDGKDKNGNDVPNGTYYIYAIKYNKDGTYKWRRKKLTLN